MSMQKNIADNMIYFLNSYPGCLFMKDAEGRYIYSSEVCQHVNSFEDSGIYGKNELEAQKDPELGRQYYEEDMKLLNEGGSLKCYSEIKTGDESFYYEINKSAVYDDSGSIIGIIGTVIDVRREFELNKQIEKQFFTDPLTGICNQRYLDNWLKKEQPLYPFTIITCDCNYLKCINDSFGHEYGDELLKSTGELFLENLPEKCRPVRVGGDEFLILCDNTDEEEAEGIIELLTEKASSKFIQGVMLSIAYGYHTMLEGEMDFEECRHLADSSMYKTKRKMKDAYLDGEGKNDPLFNQEMFKNLMKQMPVIMFFKDTECRYRYISSYNEKHLKNKVETNYGIGLTDIELQNDENRGRQYYEDDLRILATGEGCIMISAITDKEGNTSYHQITKSAVRDEEGKIIGIAGVVMDVTATKIDFNEMDLDINELARTAILEISPDIK